MLNRRHALRGLALTVGGTATGWVAKAAAAAPVLSWTPVALTSGQARLVDVVAELIIPATDTPGARQAGVPQFIDRALADYLNKAQSARLRAGLERMDVEARAIKGDIFVALTPQQQVELLTGYDREASTMQSPAPDEEHFFLMLQDLVTIGYFTSEPGATLALRYDPIPGAYDGCVPLAQLGRGWATR